MLYRKFTRKPLEQLDQDLREAVARHSFGVLNALDLKQTMHAKGVQFNREVRVYEVCNPHHAKAALQEEIAVSTALPCRIAVFSSGDGFELATLLPTELMKLFGSSKAMQDTAVQVETALKAMMEEAAGVA